MTRRRFVSGAWARAASLLFAAPFGLALGAQGCGAEEGPAPGQLAVVLMTNMTPGPDFDELTLRVTRDGERLDERPLGSWPKGGGRGTLALPATVQLVNRSAGAPQVTVRLEARQEGRLRIVREATVALPRDGIRALPLLIDWFCLDKVPVASPTDVQCNETETCVAGTCTTPEVPASALSTYDPATFFGGASTPSGASGGRCFDVLGTFDGAERYLPERAGGRCGAPFAGAPSELNVAVALPPGSQGFCYSSGGGGGGCLVPLAAGVAGGWAVAEGRITVPDRVCTTPDAKVAVVRGKPTKAENQPPCGSFSSVGAPDAATPPNATIVVTDADAGARDGGADATVDAGRIDAAAGAVDAGAVDAGADARPPDAAPERELTATTAGLAGPGLDDCGPSGNDACARSLLVPGGTFFRGADTASPATIRDFRLDKYEVTVGRFRRFVAAWVGGWRPGEGAGKHAHLNGGAGLSNTSGGYEPGWNAAWDPYVGAPSANAQAPTAPGAATLAAWDASLRCNAEYTTWASAPGPHEARPLNCLSWYDLHAFCIWDGGFVPSEAEWEYAAAGGDDERVYPWGAAPPGADASRAVYGCYFNATGACSGTTNLAPVGSAAAGAARWGHLDLAGNTWEWTLDWYRTPFDPTCVDCARLSSGSTRVLRGGSFYFASSILAAAHRGDFGSPAGRGFDYGGRCARSP